MGRGRFNKTRHTRMQVRSCGGISANPTALLQEILPDRNVKTKEMSQKKIMGYEKGERQMRTRRLGKTGLMVSEIGFGGEWLERHPEEESIEKGDQHPGLLDGGPEIKKYHR